MSGRGNTGRRGRRTKGVNSGETRGNSTGSQQRGDGVIRDIGDVQAEPSCPAGPLTPQSTLYSITRALPYNKVGPALPQALRLARCQASRLVQKDVDDLPTENDIMDQKITPEEERILGFNANVVMAWEDLYSWRHKDRTSKTSLLSFVESWRFHRALYRIWLFSASYGIDTSDSEDGEDGYSESEKLKQKRFLEKFTSKELHQIRRVAIFLLEISRWIIGAEGSLISSLDTYDFDGQFLFVGPRAILQCYEDVTVPLLRGCWSGHSDGFLTKILTKILQEREDPSHPVGREFDKLLLDKINGENDRCQKCNSNYETFPGMKRGVNLWNETNWDHFKGNLLLDLHFYVKGKLLQNKTESSLGQALRSMNYSELLHQMFDSRKGPYTSWSKEDWVCFDCLCEFFQDTLPLWWLERKRQEGKRIMEDCPGGYDCPLQVFDSGLEHAERFNHLCEPTVPASYLNLVDTVVKGYDNSGSGAEV